MLDCVSRRRLSHTLDCVGHFSLESVKFQSLALDNVSYSLRVLTLECVGVNQMITWALTWTWT